VLALRRILMKNYYIVKHVKIYRIKRRKKNKSKVHHKWLGVNGSGPLLGISLLNIFLRKGRLRKTKSMHVLKIPW